MGGVAVMNTISRDGSAISLVVGTGKEGAEQATKRWKAHSGKAKTRLKPAQQTKIAGQIYSSLVSSSIHQWNNLGAPSLT
jgi:hypothetical protein